MSIRCLSLDNYSNWIHSHLIECQIERTERNIWNWWSRMVSPVGLGWKEGYRNHELEVRWGMTYFGIQDQNHGMVLMAAWGGKWCCNGLKEPATYILVDFDYGVPLLGHDEVIVRVTGVKMGGQERMIAADCNDAGLDANATRQGIRNHYVNPSQVDAVSRLPMCMPAVNADGSCPCI